MFYAFFLLALSSAAENALHDFEKEAVDEGGKLGRDSSSKFVSFSTAAESAAMRLIRLATEVLGPRGDEKSGCRREWTAFLSKYKISQRSLATVVIGLTTYFKTLQPFCFTDII